MWEETQEAAEVPSAHGNYLDWDEILGPEDEAPEGLKVEEAHHLEVPYY